MRLWKRNKKSEPPAWKDKVAVKVAGALINLQAKVSDRMNKSRYLKTILISFCVVSGSLSAYFLIDAIITKPTPSFRIDHVRLPKHFDQSGDEVMENVLPGDIYQDIQEYRHYMDSIGEPIRPGLQDSMQMLEEIYLQQQK